jgi:predicted acetyltransferase
MARFYVYDLSRGCGFISNDWAMPADGLYESFGFKEYFEDQSRKAYLIKIGHELAGFSLLNQVGTNPTTNWNMGELFVIAKFQSKGVGGQVVHQIFNMHPGIWEVSVIPENKSALRFWESTINSYTNGNFENETKIVVYDEHQPQRIIFSFDNSRVKQ